MKVKLNKNPLTLSEVQDQHSENDVIAQVLQSSLLTVRVFTEVTLLLVWLVSSNESRRLFLISILFCSVTVCQRIEMLNGELFLITALIYRK